MKCKRKQAWCLWCFKLSASQFNILRKLMEQQKFVFLSSSIHWSIVSENYCLWKFEFGLCLWNIHFGFLGCWRAERKSQERSMKDERKFINNNFRGKVYSRIRKLEISDLINLKMAAIIIRHSMEWYISTSKWYSEMVFSAKLSFICEKFIYFFF